MGGNIRDFSHLVSAIKTVHETLATQAGRAINISLTLRNWLIGAYIAEYELNGADRATYGDKLFTELAKRLSKLEISNCNRRQLYRYLRFYRVYPDIVGTLPHNYAKSCLTPCPLIHPQETEKWGRCPHNWASLLKN